MILAKKYLVASAALLACVSSLSAGVPNLTVYENKTAFVNEDRPIKVGVGKENIVIEDISDQIKGGSLIPTFQGSTTKIISQKVVGNTLEMNIASDQPSKSLLDLKYSTDGISWKTNYAISLDDDKYMQVFGWVEIDNKTKANYDNANIYISSGDLGKDKKDLFKIYDFDINANIKAESKTQVSFIASNSVKYNRFVHSEFKHGKGDHGIVNFDFNGLIVFENIREKGLGIDMPEGNVHIYEKSSKLKGSHLVGTDIIPTTNKFKEVKIQTGIALEVKGHVEMVKYSMSKNSEKGIQKFVFKNNSSTKQVLKFRLVKPSNGRITEKDTCHSACHSSNITKNIKEYTITLAEDQEYSLRRTFDIFY